MHKPKEGERTLYIRVPVSLHEAVQADAKRAKASINAYCIYLLSQKPSNHHEAALAAQQINHRRKNPA